jgi:hypothetical protein
MPVPRSTAEENGLSFTEGPRKNSFTFCGRLFDIKI